MDINKIAAIAVEIYQSTSHGIVESISKAKEIYLNKNSKT